jgi:hypothetical protein
MDQQKILLVNLSKGKLGEMNSKLLGMIFVMKFQAAAMSRVNIPEDERKDFCLFVDEFQNFSTESFESILSEARKFRLNLFVANQFMTQLTDKIREGVLGNVGTIIAGRIGVTDAEMLEKVFTPTFKAEDLHKQPNYHAIATVMMYGMPTAPFTMNLLPPMGEENQSVLESLKNYSATKYGRPIAEVEREINERMSVKPKPVAPEAPAMPEIPEMREAGEVQAQKEIEQAMNAPVAQKPQRKSFLDKWANTQEKRKSVSETSVVDPEVSAADPEAPVEVLEQAEPKKAEEQPEKREPNEMKDGDVIKLR